MHNPEMRRILVHAGVWSALAFGLNLMWEIAQIRLYTIWHTAEGMTIAWALFHCTLGDVMIAIALYALAGLASRDVDWPRSRPWTGGTIVVVCALAFTAWSEWRNVYRVGNWAYTASMPTICGIGLAPLLQWVIVPPLILIAYRWLPRTSFAHRGNDTGT